MVPPLHDALTMAEAKPLGAEVLAAAAERTREPLVLTDGRGQLSFANNAFLELTGWDAAAVEGMPASRLVSVPEDGQILRGFIETLRAGQTWEGELSVRTAAGQSVPLEVAVSGVKDANGATVYVASGRDRSREKQLERQLETLQRLEAIGTLANGVSHRANNIFAAISGQAELLGMIASDQPQIRARVDKILEATGMGKRFVAELEAFSNREETRREAADPVPIVQRAVEFVESVLPPGVKLTTELPERGPLVSVNTKELHQVLLNLMTNGLDALRESGGTVQVSLTTETGGLVRSDEGESEPCVKLVVADDGPGVPESVQHRLFEPFFTTKSYAEFSGMGLATSHGIVQRHGGTIEVGRSALGGAAFTVRLPLLRAGLEDDPPRVSERTAGQSNGTVLLIDKAGFALDSGLRLLRTGGWTALGASTLEEAQAALRSTPAPDIVVTPSELPDGTWLDLKASSSTADQAQLAWVLVAGMDEALDEDQARAEGAAGIVRKPCSAAAFLKTVGEALKS